MSGEAEPSEPLEPLDAALRVLREEGRPLHWTAIQDLALALGIVDGHVAFALHVAHRQHEADALGEQVEDLAVDLVDRGA